MEGLDRHRRTQNRIGPTFDHLLAGGQRRIGFFQRVVNGQRDKRARILATACKEIVSNVFGRRQRVEFRFRPSGFCCRLAAQFRHQLLERVELEQLGAFPQQV